MVYIEVIYLLLYSIVCFLVVKNIYKNKVDAIYDDYVDMLGTLKEELSKTKSEINSHFVDSRERLSKQNELYLSEMNKDVSKKLKELSDNVKNRPII
jgi:hypothetical protein